MDNLEKLNIELKLDDRGQGKVLVNGEDWSMRVKGVHLSSEAGGQTFVSLTVWPSSVHIETPAAVHVTNIHIDVVGEVNPPEQ